MAGYGYGNKPIVPSSVFVPVSNPTTATLLCELDSTQLGTQNLAPGQSLLMKVTWVFGGSTNQQFQAGTCASTALASGVDEFYPRCVTGQSAQFVTEHELKANYRIRARMFSTTTSVSEAYISATVQV